MRAIISRDLYIFYPISKDHFFVFKEVFSENSVLMYGLYSRAASNQERLMMARVRYIDLDITTSVNCSHQHLYQLTIKLEIQTFAIYRDLVFTAYKTVNCTGWIVYDVKIYSYCANFSHLQSKLHLILKSSIDLCITLVNGFSLANLIKVG